MRIDKAFKMAYQYYQAGDLNRASNVYKKILKAQPGNIDLLRFLGGICYQLGDYNDAIRYIKKEIEIAPSNADAYNNLGLVLQAKGLFSGAIDCFRKAITLKPHFQKAYYNLGLAFYNTGQPDEAILNYKKAIQIEPGLVEAYNNLGVLLRARGHLEEAITYFQKALQLNPDYADIYNNLGLCLKDNGNIDDAMVSYQKAINLNPDFADAYYNLGIALQDKNQLDEAINFYKKALQLNPDYASAYNNLGSIYHDKRQFNEAIDCYQNALKLKPNFINAYYNLSSVMREKGNLNESLFYCKKILELNPYHAEAYFNISSIFLLTGDFEQGWREYEWRSKIKDYIKREFPQPLWDGSDITGQTILLYAEQGFGDAIQFIRYVPLVAQQGTRVILVCSKELKSLFKTIEGLCEVVGAGEQLPEFDVHCPLLSLPLKFNTNVDTIPAEIPYIKVNPSLIQKWKDKVKDENSKLKVGLSWAGRPEHKNDRNRSFPLDTFTPLAQFDNIVFYSLQKGKGSEQAKSPPEGMKLIDYTDEIKDFSDTAALIENLDLVISADTAVVHLAGALGKPVWTLIPFDPDWRWMLNREDSPWYPTMRLFRQPSPGDWKSVISHVEKELYKRINFK